MKNEFANRQNRHLAVLALRPSFGEVTALLGKMDRLVLRFRTTELGTRFAIAWKAARTIRDLGQSSPEKQNNPTPQVS